MKDPRKILRQKEYAALNGNINVSGIVPVYSMINPNKDEVKFLLIKEATFNDALDEGSDKDGFGSFVTTTFEAIQKFEGDLVDTEVVDQIANDVLEIIVPIDTSSYLDLSPDFQICDTVLDSSPGAFEADDSGRPVYVNRFVIRYLIQEL